MFFFSFPRILWLWRSIYAFKDRWEYKFEYTKCNHFSTGSHSIKYFFRDELVVSIDHRTSTSNVKITLFSVPRNRNFESNHFRKKFFDLLIIAMQISVQYIFLLAIDQQFLIYPNQIARYIAKMNNKCLLQKIWNVRIVYSTLVNPCSCSIAITLKYIVFFSSEQGKDVTILKIAWKYRRQLKIFTVKSIE